MSMRNATKALALTLTVITIATILSACGGSGIPNGRYEPVDPMMALTIQAIVINGNNFTQVMPYTGMGTTLKFTYKNGTLTFPEGGLSVPCEYKDGSLWYGGAEFVLTK
jgi:hypothetical protein